MKDDCFYWCARGDLPAVRGGGSRIISLLVCFFGFVPNYGRSYVSVTL